MADAEWRMQRISRLQAAYVTSAAGHRRDYYKKCHSDKPQPGQEQVVGDVMQHGAADTDRFARYEIQLQRIFMNAYKQLMAFRDRLKDDRQLSNAQAELERDPNEPSTYRRVKEVISPYYQNDGPEHDEAPPQVQSQSQLTPKKPTTSDPPASTTSDESAA